MIDSFALLSPVILEIVVAVLLTTRHATLGRYRWVSSAVMLIFGTGLLAALFLASTCLSTLAVLADDLCIDFGNDPVTVFGFMFLLFATVNLLVSFMATIIIIRWKRPTP